MLDAATQGSIWGADDPGHEYVTSKMFDIRHEVESSRVMRHGLRQRHPQNPGMQLVLHRHRLIQIVRARTGLRLEGQADRSATLTVRKELSS